jgi:plasmid rolling circle replication initiator protein Rep
MMIMMMMMMMIMMMMIITINDRDDVYNKYDHDYLYRNEYDYDVIRYINNSVSSCINPMMPTLNVA